MGVFDDKTDEELVILTLKDKENFVYLIRRYEDKLLRYIKRISGADDAEDILQNSFIKAYENLNSFNTSLKFSSWIYRICHNEVINNYRKKKARPKTIAFEGLENLVFDNISIDVYNLSKILKDIDIKYREVLVLRYIEEKDYKEISDILKKPMGTVSTLLNRAKKQLKQRYEQYTRKGIK